MSNPIYLCLVDETLTSYDAQNVAHLFNYISPVVKPLSRKHFCRSVENRECLSWYTKST